MITPWEEKRMATTLPRMNQAIGLNQLSPETTKREPAILVALERLQKVVTVVDEQVSSLLVRLAPLCSPRVECAQERCNSVQHNVPLVNPIHAACDSLERTLEKLNAVRDTLEL
jgi:hypothetical protein